MTILLGKDYLTTTRLMSFERARLPAVPNNIQRNAGFGPGSH
jgi:hypothetical protein